jgi:hypothetical protein
VSSTPGSKSAPAAPLLPSFAISSSSRSETRGAGSTSAFLRRGAPGSLRFAATRTAPSASCRSAICARLMSCFRSCSSRSFFLGPSISSIVVGLNVLSSNAAGCAARSSETS